MAVDVDFGGLEMQNPSREWSGYIILALSSCGLLNAADKLNPLNPLSDKR